MTENGPSWGDMANTTWGELAGEPVHRSDTCHGPCPIHSPQSLEQESPDPSNSVRGPRLLDFMVDLRDEYDTREARPSVIEIDIEQKLLALIAELETLKARVAELEAAAVCPCGRQLSRRLCHTCGVLERTFGRAHP